MNKTSVSKTPINIQFVTTHFTIVFMATNLVFPFMSCTFSLAQTGLVSKRTRK